jgi:hypothetical protein
LLPAGAVAGWVLHPLESAAFARRTPQADIPALFKRYVPPVGGTAVHDLWGAYELGASEIFATDRRRGLAAKDCVCASLSNAACDNHRALPSRRWDRRRYASACDGNKLTDALGRALDDANVRKRLLELGSDIPDKAMRGPQPLAALVESEIAKWTPIIKAAGVSGN